MKHPDVLVLNKSFVPIHIVSWQKCMTLISQGVARALDDDFVSYDFKDWLIFSKMDSELPFISTVDRRIAIPEVIALTTYSRLHSSDVKYSRQTLFQRDSFTCGYCGKKFKANELTIDHIVPKSKGGKTTWDNTVSACVDCNGTKSNMMLSECKMRLIHKPRKPKWLGPFQNVPDSKFRKSWRKFMDRPLMDDSGES